MALSLASAIASSMSMLRSIRRTMASSGPGHQVR
jgi:hypothetical protein